jgi:hypothetical protein
MAIPTNPSSLPVFVKRLDYETRLPQKATKSKVPLVHMQI